MTNKDRIIDLFYNRHLKPKDIAFELNVSNAYITKIIKNDSRYISEKNFRKSQNKNKHKEFTIKYMKVKQQNNRESYEALMKQLEKDSLELSYHYDISNFAFRKCNSSAYIYKPKKHRFEIDKKLTVSDDVPKIIYCRRRYF